MKEENNEYIKALNEYKVAAETYFKDKTEDNKNTYETAKENYKSVCITLLDELMIENQDILKRMKEH